MEFSVYLSIGTEAIFFIYQCSKQRIVMERIHPLRGVASGMMVSDQDPVVIMVTFQYGLICKRYSTVFLDMVLKKNGSQQENPR